MEKMHNILVTAGPTRERLDGVRFISNFSTGKMGYEIAQAALDEGYSVTLISGPTEIAPPKGARLVRVESALEMEKAVRINFKKSDCLFMASAVCDWRPKRPAAGKIKKRSKKNLSLKLVQNPDIVAGIAKEKEKRLVAGFALEAVSLIPNAKRKLKDKDLDFIVANRLGKKSPFGPVRTDATIIDRYGRSDEVRNAAKGLIARRALKKAEELWAEER